MTDLEIAFNAIQNKRETYDRLWAYYDGDQPLVYSTQRLRDVFQSLDARFEQNWCTVVVDSVLDRLVLRGLSVPGDAQASAWLAATWAGLDLGLEAEDAHLAALAVGESFLIAWPDAQGKPQLYYNDPRLCHVEYDPAQPHTKLWAAKLWLDQSAGRWRITLYYPDRLEYYESATVEAHTPAAFAPSTQASAPNPCGQTPVFHLRREGRAVRSEFATALTQQDAINKLLSDMMVAAEYSAFRQRYIISNSDVTTLRNAPNEIWSIPAGEAGVGSQDHVSVGEFGQTDLANYLDAMRALALSIGVITRTPKFYMYAQGGNPSGEALAAMEAPLIAKCLRYAERFGSVWQQAGAFLLRLGGFAVQPGDVRADFDITGRESKLARLPSSTYRSAEEFPFPG